MGFVKSVLKPGKCSSWALAIY
uniref:Uncharacterized protein n=1 Tax=Anguilla anguilla TaxID=7936 RepID=A0A0E9RYZ6_ANGAN